jgi:UDP:flavonoid glycosyltransferase YjiC (YdhE family)
MACLELGLPMVAMPLAGDQPANAARCIDLGVARLVTPDERTSVGIREAVLEVLSAPRYRENAMRMRRELQTLPGPDHAVALLERLAFEKAPINNAKSQ